MRGGGVGSAEDPRMNRQTIFKSLAKHYDLLYSWKDYKKEVGTIRELIRIHKQSPGNDLLEVACGTGKHAELFQSDFSIVATDLNEDMLRIARARRKRVSFVRADMASLDLGRQFDVVLCLFSSIGYVRTRASEEDAAQFRAAPQGRRRRDHRALVDQGQLPDRSRHHDHRWQ